MTSQLTLPVGLSDSASFENFHAPQTRAAVEALKTLASSDRNAGALLLGQSGSGKTHLAWALCRLARDQGRSALYIPMRQTELALSLLSDMPERAVVCVDDLLPNLDLGLADLVSRIGALPGHELKSLGDSEKSSALRLRATARGLAVSDDAIDYILRHTPRDTHALFGLLDELDRASLAAQRRVTLPLVREVIARA